MCGSTHPGQTRGTAGIRSQMTLFEPVPHFFKDHSFHVRPSRKNASVATWRTSACTGVKLTKKPAEMLLFWNHYNTIHFYILTSTCIPLILGYPWLCLHIIMTPWQPGSLLIFIPFRPCTDYRGPQWQYALPLISSAFKLLEGATIFAKASPPQHLPPSPHPRWRRKTSFNTLTGHYEYVIMPFWSH